MHLSEITARQTLFYSGGWEVKEMLIETADVSKGVWAFERLPWGDYGDRRRVESKYLHKTREEAQAAINDAVAAS